MVAASGPHFRLGIALYLASLSLAELVTIPVGQVKDVRLVTEPTSLWETQDTWSFFCGGYRVISGQNESVSLSFTGNTSIITFLQDQVGGVARITLDGVIVADVDTFGGDNITSWRDCQLFSWRSDELPPGTHTVTVTSLDKISGLQTELYLSSFGYTAAAMPAAQASSAVLTATGRMSSGAVFAGAIGGSTIIILLIGFTVFYTRRRGHHTRLSPMRAGDLLGLEEVAHYPNDKDPFQAVSPSDRVSSSPSSLLLEQRGAHTNSGSDAPVPHSTSRVVEAVTASQKSSLELGFSEKVEAKQTVSFSEELLANDTFTSIEAAFISRTVTRSQSPFEADGKQIETHHQVDVHLLRQSPRVTTELDALPLSPLPATSLRGKPAVLSETPNDVRHTLSSFDGEERAGSRSHNRHSRTIVSVLTEDLEEEALSVEYMVVQGPIRINGPGTNQHPDPLPEEAPPDASDTNSTDTCSEGEADEDPATAYTVDGKDGVDEMAGLSRVESAVSQGEGAVHDLETSHLDIEHNHSEQTPPAAPATDPMDAYTRGTINQRQSTTYTDGEERTERESPDGFELMIMSVLADQLASETEKQLSLERATVQGPANFDSPAAIHQAHDVDSTYANQHQSLQRSVSLGSPRSLDSSSEAGSTSLNQPPDDILSPESPRLASPDSLGNWDLLEEVQSALSIPLQATISGQQPAESSVRDPPDYIGRWGLLADTPSTSSAQPQADTSDQQLPSGDPTSSDRNHTERPISQSTEASLEPVLLPSESHTPNVPDSLMSRDSSADVQSTLAPAEVSDNDPPSSEPNHTELKMPISQAPDAPPARTHPSIPDPALSPMQQVQASSHAQSTSTDSLQSLESDQQSNHSISPPSEIHQYPFVRDSEPETTDLPSGDASMVQDHPLLRNLAGVGERYDDLQQAFRDCHNALQNLRSSMSATLASDTILKPASIGPKLQAAIEYLYQYTEDARAELEIRAADEFILARGFEAILSPPVSPRSRRIDLPQIAVVVDDGEGDMSQKLPPGDIEGEIQAFVDGTDTSVQTALRGFNSSLEDIRHDIAVIEQASREAGVRLQTGNVLDIESAFHSQPTVQSNSTTSFSSFGSSEYLPASSTNTGIGKDLSAKLGLRVPSRRFAPKRSRRPTLRHRKSSKHVVGLGLPYVLRQGE